MSAAIKPEVHMSWTPTGQVGLKPQIFATYIPSTAPKREKISADVWRKISEAQEDSGTGSYEIDEAGTWRYENIGTADSLIVSGTTLTNLPETQSKTGKAFYQTTRAKCFDLLATSEIWMKFDVYFDGSNRWRAYNGGTYDITGITAQTRGDLSLFSNGSDKGDYGGVCKANRLQIVLLHMISGSANGVIEAWVDGAKIYTYTGDVNHGEGFADIYLQSDGAGTFFSNVIISNAEIGLDEDATVVVPVTYDCRVKPEIYLSWIPRGEVGLNSLLFASYIPLPDKIHADLFREIIKTEAVPADLSRQVVKPESTQADTNRHITKTEKIIADIFRKIGLTTARGETQRKVANIVKRIADTCRETDGYDKISADTNREITCTEKVAADTSLDIGAIGSTAADLRRRLTEYARADLSLKVVRAEKVTASTVIRVPHVLNYVVENAIAPQRLFKVKNLSAGATSLINTFKDYGVTAINITLNERTLSDDFSFDIAARTMNINEAVSGKLLDYSFNFLVEETNQTDLIQSVKGKYSVDDLLYTQIFIPSTKIKIDDYELEVAGSRWSAYSGKDYENCYPKASEVMAAVAQALGLKLSMQIDDFTPYNLSADYRVTYADIISTIFGWTSRLPQRQVNVFIRGKTLYCIQRGKESGTFDITNLAHSSPTVKKKLIRSLWSNPREDEVTDTDADDTGTDDPDSGDDSGGGTTTDTSSTTDETDNPLLEYLYDEYQQAFSGTISFSGDGYATSWTYSNGLLMTEKQSHGDDRNYFSGTTSYTYAEIFPSNMSELSIGIKKTLNKNFYGDFYLISKRTLSTSRKYDGEVVTETKQTSDTTYNYGRTDGDEVYLISEVGTTTTNTYRDGVLEDSDSDSSEVYHVPIGNGWYGQCAYRNGECQGSNISQGKPGNKVSQYTIGEVQKSFKGWTVTYDLPDNSKSKLKSKLNGKDADDDDDADTSSTVSGGSDDATENPKAQYDDWRKQLSPIADTSFPVRELELLSTLTEELFWLNRKIEETVTVDLLAKINNGVPDITHIVDFTERVKFNGADYFLVSNNITFTPRKLVQRLQLIRWY